MAKQSSKKWTAEDKLKVLQETHGLTEQELGAYLRKHGLHSQRLMEWRNDFIESLAKANKPVLKDERDERIKELETEVLRKDKALAEASALLILQKKVDLIWARSKEGKK